MSDPIEDLLAVAERHPEHALLIRTIRAQMREAELFPESDAVRATIAANVERLRAALGGRK